VAPNRVTSKDVAHHAGVSRTTVSLVLNNVPGVQITEVTRSRVIQVAGELGYVPEAAAKALASRRSGIIGLILTRSPHHIASDAFLTQILDCLSQNVRQTGIRLLLDIVEEDHHRDTYLELTRARRIDGIILSGPKFNDKALRALEKDGFPTILMGDLPGTSFYSVDVDNFSAAGMATRHLINLGHTRIGFITNAKTAFTASEERLRGYKETIEASGIAFDPRYVRYGDFDPESGYKQMKSLLKEKPCPTAAFVASDVVCFGAMAAIREKKLRIPEDIALMGFDDVPFSRYIDPALTTVHLPAVELAQLAFNILLLLIGGDTPTEKQTRLDTHLVIRQSCGADRHGRGLTT
jgi:LacI family transcriptional regulator